MWFFITENSIGQANKKMEEFIDKLVSQITNLVPLLIIGNVDTQKIYFMIVPLIVSSLIPFIIKQIKLFYKKEPPKNEIVLPKCSLEIFRTFDNQKFVIVQQYLTEDLKSKETAMDFSTELDLLPISDKRSRFVFDSATSVQKWFKVKYNQTEVWYMFQPLNTDKIEQKDVKTSISLQNKAKYCNIILRHDDKQVLLEFLHFIINEHSEKTAKSKFTSDITIFTDRHGGSVYKLSTIKTFDNVFCVFTDQIKTIVSDFSNSKHLYQKHGIPYKISFLFHGIPGTGKSSMLYAMSHEFKRKLIFMRYLNSSIQTNFANENNFDFEVPVIIVFEEIDLLLQNSSDKSIFSVDENVLSSLLFLLDGYTGLDNMILIFTTNHIENLPVNLTRAGRMDHHFKFDYALPQQIIEMFRCYYDVKVDVEFSETVQITTSDLINHYFLVNLKNMQKCIDDLRNKNIVVTVK